MPADTLVILDRPSLDADAHPYRSGDVDVTDLGFTRGDGIFETINLVDGRVQALDAHLDRFERSARMLDLPRPDCVAWRDAIATAVAQHPRVPEAIVKTILTRGVEGSGRPTGVVFVQTSPDFGPARRDGVRVVLLDRGLRSDVQHTSPWLLVGAKTLSYAVNRAAAREAVRRGADDALFVSSDGYLLEGPSANLVLLIDEELVTPPPSLGLLPGTTQGDLFELAPTLGLRTAIRPLRAPDLDAANAAWLVSSARNAAPIRSVDGVDRPVDGDLSARINAALLTR
ncbi:aminotransferase class IV [Rathayibacter iranicus]|uniref:Aminodeoxychorismate lyase n=2 Tax=Rathayibacter iranicus TaxID=59737 RepID=A0AAD1AD34_9MICO|nr:aminotransferase class IV [Rathayibacter iranicus]AZZ54830.1 aminodeoxychorismate lyase [Rathayibacter iranicus]MWV31398.1 aminodeoxychorismate lyase [Rathayibacter iranicus NCPPB 2253 = VKM Ac-1602]PPI50355.1 aminodeoxychorismate lyase [Rathayibacter iranicus]PPI62750.1 aminodeoxychorismate lyase [Rathayibacter iranicus]PPI73823.1 aminodeoxychorismate lyase [Rathayibacter iranicus]